jgi:AcrR family transcriptional regulator
MNPSGLDKEIILNAAEEAIRRFGPSKTNITDIAKILKVSHAAIYRHYENKAVLLEAVTERWLSRVSRPLEPIMKENNDPEAKLRCYLKTLCQNKRSSVIEDPEMFENFAILTQNSKEALSTHVEQLFAQLEEIIRKGMEAGVFETDDPREMAVTVFTATSRFHYPAFAKEWENPNIESLVNSVIDLILNGVKKRN